MKTSVDILGLPVIDISEGDEIGTISKMVIDPAEGAVAALVIDDGKWYQGAKLLPFSGIAGLGESALTIISNTAILSIEKAPELEQLLCNDVTVIGTKVLTKTGRIEGTVKEIMIDMTGKIATCEIEDPNGEVSTIAAERILTFGKKVLVITDENEIPVAPAVPVAAQAAAIPEIQPAAAAAPEIKPAATAAPEVKSEAPVKENSSDDSARKFDEKQRKYLLGKQASRRIETDNGVVIVEQGGEINEEVLQKAKLAGKFVELSMNIQ